MVSLNKSGDQNNHFHEDNSNKENDYYNPHNSFKEAVLDANFL